jgi:hypothetical protein
VRAMAAAGRPSEAGSQVRRPSLDTFYPSLVVSRTLGLGSPRKALRDEVGVVPALLRPAEDMGESGPLHPVVRLHALPEVQLAGKFLRTLDAWIEHSAGATLDDCPQQMSEQGGAA